MQLNPDGGMMEAGWNSVHSSLSLPLIGSGAFSVKWPVSSGHSDEKDPNLSEKLSPVADGLVPCSSACFLEAMPPADLLCSFI